MMVKSGIEVIFEECGWNYVPKEEAWRLDKFRVSKAKLHQALDEGKGKVLREKFIAVLQNGLKEGLQDAELRPQVEATVERLEPRKKN